MGQGWPSYDGRPIAFWWSVILCCFGTVMLTVVIPCSIWGYFRRKSIGAGGKKVPPPEIPSANQFRSDKQAEQAKGRQKRVALCPRQRQRKLQVRRRH